MTIATIDIDKNDNKMFKMPTPVKNDNNGLSFCHVHCTFPCIVVIFNIRIRFENKHIYMVVGNYGNFFTHHLLKNFNDKTQQNNDGTFGQSGSGEKRVF